MNGYAEYILRTPLFNLKNLKKFISIEFRKIFEIKDLKVLGNPKGNNKELKLNKKQIKTLLWLDDRINPLERRMDWLAYSPIGRDVEVIWVKNILDFKNLILKNGLPDAICFDYDLGNATATGYDCAKWLVMYCQHKKLAPPLWASQSTNPDGKAKINRLLKNFVHSL